MADRFAGWERSECLGVPVLTCSDERRKTFRVTLLLRRPLDASAAARFLIPRLLVQGTLRDPDRPALLRRMERLYGASALPGLVKLGESQVLSFSLDAVAGAVLPGAPDQLGEGLHLLGDLLTRPRLEGAAFPPAVFAREREQAVAEVRALADDKGAYAAERAVAELCAGEPYARPEHGGLQALEACTAAGTEAARLELLAHGEALLLAAGALPAEGIAAHAGQLLSGFPTRLPQLVPPPVLVAARAPRRVCERMPLRQGKLALLFRFPSPSTADGWIGRRLFASLLGGGPHSRLFTELREKRSLCYYAHAAPDRHKPVLFVHIGLDPAAAPAAEAEILRIRAELAAGGFSAQEFATAKAQAISALRSVDDSLASRIAFVADQWWAATDRDPATQADAYARATPGQVVAAVAGMHYDGSYLLAPEAAP